MGKNKKIILGLSVLFTMVFAFVIGIMVANVKPSKTPKIPEGDKYLLIEATNNNKLSFTYQPSINATTPDGEEVTKVYEYCFGNTTSSDDIAINLLTNLQSSVTNADILYAFSSSKYETIPNDIIAHPVFKTQTISHGANKYIYVFVDVIDPSQEVTFDVDLQWAYGHSTTLTYNVDGEIITDTQVFNSDISAYNTNGAKTSLGYGIETWYTDAACTTQVTFPYRVTTGQTLYAKNASNLNPAWLTLNTSGTAYQVKYPEGTTESAIVGGGTDLRLPSRYNGLPVTSTLTGALSSQSIGRLYIPASYTSIGYLYGGSGYNIDYIVVAQDNKNYDSRNNCNALIKKDTAELIAGSNNAYIPDGVKILYAHSFRNLKALTSIHIPSSVTEIRNYAFVNCSALESVTFDKDSQLQSIGDYCFQSNALTRITIPASATKVGYYAFRNCNSLKSISFEDTNTWYVTSDSTYAGGDAVDTIDYVANKTNLVTTYLDKFWYKSPKTVNMIYDADDLLAIANDGTTYEYYQLANDIDLNVYESTTLDAVLASINRTTNTSGVYAMIDTFTGRIDGDGHTIKMPNHGGVPGYAYVVGHFNGELCNVTLDYSELQTGQEISFAYSCRAAARFRNITTNGTLNVPNTGNYSPLIIYAYAHLSFENCTNNMDILGPIRYGSPFLGGAVIGTRDYIIKNDIEKMYIEIIKDINISYDNCVNNGELIMQYAAMLQGNSYKIPNLNNLYVNNCVNNGNILGTIEANYFCSVYQDWYPEFEAWNNYARQNIHNGSGSFCGVQPLTSMSTTYDSVTGIISVTNTGSDANDYTYRLSLSAYLTEAGSTQYGGFIITEMDVSLGQTQYGYYRFVDDIFLKTLGTLGVDYTKTAVTGTNLSYRGRTSSDTQLCLITDTDTGAKYYYYDLYPDLADESNEWYVVDNPHVNCVYFTYTITAYDSYGKWAGSLTVQAPEA